jgi:hypothetical protein
LIKVFLKEKVDSGMYYLYSVKRKEICSEEKRISDYFDDLDFVVLTKKSFVEYQLDNLVDSIFNLTLSKNRNDYQSISKEDKDK